MLRYMKLELKPLTQLLSKVALEKQIIDFHTNNNTTSILPNSTLESHKFNIRANTKINDKLSIDSKATYFTQQIHHRGRSGTEGVVDQYIICLEMLFSLTLKNTDG